MLVSTLKRLTPSGTHATLGLHTNTFFWHFSSGQTQTVTLAVFAGLLAGAPLAGPMLKRMEKRTVLLIGLIGLIGLLWFARAGFGSAWCVLLVTLLIESSSQQVDFIICRGDRRLESDATLLQNIQLSLDASFLIF